MLNLTRFLSLQIKKLPSWQINLVVFLLAAIVVSSFHFIVLKQAFEIGFSPDDWDLYLRFKSLGVAPLTKIGQVWAERGLYTTPFIYYLGLLDTLVGFNYRSFQTVNIVFKMLAALSLFPLILLVFKNKMLAFLSTLLFAVSYSSIGSLDYPVKGADYVSIFWMNIFLIIYYNLLKRTLNFVWYTVGLLILMVSISFSPIRMFPLLALLPAIEVYLMIKTPRIRQLKESFLRILFFYLPFIFLISHVPSILVGSPLLGIFQRVVKGDWYILLSPLSGFGYTFITAQQWGSLFGLIKADNLGQYVDSLIGRPLATFGFLTLLFSFLISERKKVFFFIVLILNFIVDLIIFFIAFNYRYFPIKHDVNFYTAALYPVLFGGFILTVSLVYFIIWLKAHGERISLLPLLSGFTFLSIFTFATWVFAPSGTSFTETSYYLVVATIGTSIFLAGFLMALLNIALHTKKSSYKFLSIFFIVISFTLIFSMDYKEITDHFKIVSENGRDSTDQKIMQGKITGKVGTLKSSNPMLFYFDGSEVGLDSTFYIDTLLLTLPSWMHLQNGKVVDGCVETFYKDKKELAKLVVVKNEEKVFAYRGLCLEVGGKGVYYKDIFYKPENFYAFKLRNREIIDIKKQTLEDLGF